jgi:hypothetical protein
MASQQNTDFDKNMLMRNIVNPKNYTQKMNSELTSHFLHIDLHYALHLSSRKSLMFSNAA